MSSKLTIGMATFKEFSDVWFTLSALTANHPRVEYLVVDNSPERCTQTEAIVKACKGTYYHRPDLTGTSAPRDAVFRFAKTPWVMCIDSHLIFEAGAIQSLLDWIDKNEDSRDMVQGPLAHDDGISTSTEWLPTTKGLWGEWHNRQHDGEPFEIQMMGLGLFAMRKDRWPGFHPQFRGFGGEEGYLHEKIRQRGDKTICLPGLRWRHKFRDLVKTPPPYKNSLFDHTVNLLLGHKELGIEADAEINEHFGKRIGMPAWLAALSAINASPQEFGKPPPEQKRQRILGIWYTDNTAPGSLIRQSAESVHQANWQAKRHDVDVVAVSWELMPEIPLDNIKLAGEKVRSHATIIKQIEQGYQYKTQSGRYKLIMKKEGVFQDCDSCPPSPEYDLICFLEHDVLYPPNYFDIVGDAFSANPNATVVSHLNYIGLNSTGWQHVRERHEPLHQLAVAVEIFKDNLERAKLEHAATDSAILEPDHGQPRSNWIRIPASGAAMPSVHVNHNAGRFTSHGDVCYEPVGYSKWHWHWGEAERYWPGQMSQPLHQVQAAQTSSCGSCGPSALEKLPKCESLVGQASDINEHLMTLKELASKCDSATELSHWYKPADIAIREGLRAGGTFTSVCPSAKPTWIGERFKGIAQSPAALESIEPTDLLFIDTEHTAAALYPLLDRHKAKVNKYIVVHCTETFGEVGDDGTAGVLHALRGFCHTNKEWVVKQRDRNNHGLMVLSRCEEDVKELPSLFKKAMNYANAKTKHLLAGQPIVSDEVLAQRQEECAICEYRAMDACSACGCPLESKLPFATEPCGLVKLGLKPKWDAVQA
jgi:hypothetical protein